PAPRRQKGRTHHVLEAIYADLTGPMHVPAIFSGARYILTIVDDYSRRVFTFTLRTRDEAGPAIECFIQRREKETGYFVKSLTTDRSEEHTSELQSRGHVVCR